jgi:diguanylate cyclase (GGDEF)-like protein/PAS domain S-box-containing protein
MPDIASNAPRSQIETAPPQGDGPASAPNTSASDDVPLGLCLLDTDARLIMCNDRYVEMYGVSRDVIKPGCSLLEILEHRKATGTFVGDTKAFADIQIAAIHAGRAAKHVVELSDGRVVSIINQPMADAGWISAHEDITARKQAEQELHRTRAFLDTVIDNIPECLYVEDTKEYRLLLCNRAGAEILGMSREAAVGKNAHDVLPPDEADFVTARDREIVESGQAIVLGEHWMHTPGGARLMSTKKVVIPDADGKHKYLLILSDDVTERRRAEEQIAHMAHHDPLTDLPNRSAFTERLMFAIERAAETPAPFGLLCLDLDRFKEVNDVFGHSAGDQLLRQVSRRLQAAAEGAFLARLGGDEFMVITPTGDQPATTAALADRLIAEVEKDFEIEGNQLRVGLSIGAAIFPNDGVDATTLLGNADAALYRAKIEGRGLIRFFEPDMDKRLRERRALQHDLRSALDRGQLSLHYQPQARVDGEIIGFEALARWQHPLRGSVPPSTFIPIAEESGLMIPLGEWILREACREAASWQRPLQIAVNLSPVQFRHGDLPALVHAILLETGLPASRLELEITEGVLIHDFSRALSILRRLKSLGVRIAMDDFGTGYSSLAYLQSFPFDKIKIDRGFISNLERNPQSAAIVRAVIGLGRGLKLPVVAEGVETEDQLSFLAKELCDEVQGYFIGRPWPIDRYAELVDGPQAVRPATPPAKTVQAG